MNAIPSSAALAASRPPAAARAVLALLSRIRQGSLSLTLPDGLRLEFGRGHPHAQLQVHQWRVFGESLSQGDVGFAEAYLRGEWTTPSLIDVLDVMVANRAELEDAIYGRWWSLLIARVRHLLHRNSRRGSRRNIHAHYDLGNPFYSLWLDPSMTYSSALFDADRPDMSLEEAQHAKYGRILDELGLPAGATVLEIGCGWGGFAEQAAQAGLSVKGLTLSTEQLAWAQARMQRHGLDSRVALCLQDYRDEHARYDGVVSIEMFEAVGEAYWPEYFRVLARSLKPGARAVIQTITIADEHFERYRHSTDFIQQYIFPGGMLPSPSVFLEQARRAGLRVVRQHAFAGDYARTLALWREAFLRKVDTIRGQGFDERFLRVWEFYLAYCEAAFRHQSTDVIQFTLEAAPADRAAA